MVMVYGKHLGPLAYLSIMEVWFFYTLNIFSYNEFEISSKGFW